MAKVNTNVNPYYDDFQESKNYHRILFKPGQAVQARELTQLQTVIYNQIKRFANHIFKDGTVIQKSDPSTIQPNEAVTSIKLSGTPDVTAYLDKFVTGVTSNVVAKVLKVYAADNPTIGDPPTIVAALKPGYENDGVFNSGEILNFYNNYSDAVSKITTTVTATTATDFVYAITGTTSELTAEVSVASTSGIEIGDYLVNPNLPDGLYVIEILNSTSFRTNKRVNATLISSTIFMYRKSSAPVIAVGISEGVYYKNGYFIKVDPQIVVVDKYKRYPDKSVILKYNEEIITSDDDNSLLDPALGSSNYFARGADRLKVSLVGESVDLKTDGTPDYNDEYIELVRYKKGVASYLNEETQYSEIDNQIQKRSFDTTGNFFVKDFRLLPYSVNNESLITAFSVTPGIAFVGGREVKSISNYLLGIDKARVTATIENSNFSPKYGQYFIVQNPEGSVIPEDTLVTEYILEAHSVSNPTDRSTLVYDTMVLKHLEFHGTEGSNVAYKAYFHYATANVAASKATNIACFISEPTLSGSSYASPKFKANINYLYGTYQSPNPLQGNVILYDSAVNTSLIYPLAKKYIKNVQNINVQYVRKFANLTASGGVVTASVASPERFVGGAGTVLTTSTALQNYYAVIKTSSGSYVAGKYVRLDGAGISLSISSTGTGLSLNLNDAAFSGKVDLYTTIDNNSVSPRLKTLVSNRVYVGNLYYSGQVLLLPNADIKSFKNVFPIGGNSYLGIYNVSSTYASNVFVSNGYIIYRANITSTGAALSNTSAWQRVDPLPSYLFKFDSGSTSQYHSFGSIKYLGANATAPGNVLLVYDHYLHSPSSGTSYLGPSIASSYSEYGDIPTFIFDGISYNLRDSIDFRPIREESSFYSQNLVFRTSIVPNPNFTDADSDLEYYLGRKDRFYVVNNEASDIDPAEIFYVDKGVSSETPVVNPDLSDATKQSICILSIPPYTRDSSVIDIEYTPISRYTMKDIGDIDKKLSRLEKIVNRHDIELTGLAQRIYKSDGSITLNISIFTDDFSTTIRSDFRNRYFSAAINTVEGYCSPKFTKNIIPIQLQNTADVSVSGSFVTTKNTEETMISQLGVSHFNTVNLAEASVDTGRIKVTPEIIYDYGSSQSDSGGNSSSSPE